MADSYAEFEAKVLRHGMSALDYQRNLVAMGTNGVSEADRHAIADLCIAARVRGEANVSVWHHAAKYFGTPCDCAMCAATAAA